MRCWASSRRRCTREPVRRGVPPRVEAPARAARAGRRDGRRSGGRSARGRGRRGVRGGSARQRRVRSPCFRSGLGERARHRAAAPVGPGAIVGTSIFGAGVLPSNAALASGRRTVLARRPQAIAITFGNTGGQIVELAHLTVQIGLNHTYQFTARRLVPNSHKTVRITLPADLPSRFKVLAVTRPVPGETNTQNNERIWRVTIGR